MSSRRRLGRRQKLPRVLLKPFMQWLFRALSRFQRRRTAEAGFVFPVTTMLVLMVMLTTAALTYRTFSRSEQVIAQREQQVILNAATPAIDRARAKIAFLFEEDPRFPSGLPNSDVLADLMSVQHGGDNFVGYTGRVLPLAGSNDDPYTLPDETRVDINDDGVLDNAWYYLADIDQDGEVEDDEIVAYSILVDDEALDIDNTISGYDSNFLPPLEPPLDSETVNGQTKTGVLLSSEAARNKARALVTRTGPLATTQAAAQCPGAVAEGGWQVVDGGNNSSLQKNFQVTAFVANANEFNSTVETLEFQQSRIADRANKWGAWFRYDLEIFPGGQFDWNGAMHTDGNVVLHTDGFSGGRLEIHMVSSHNSCLYSQQSSEITLGQFDNDDDGTVDVASGDFQGQAIRGNTRDNAYENDQRVRVHVWDGVGVAPILTEAIRNQNDSVDGGAPLDVAMNPLVLFTQDEEEHINASTWSRDADWETRNFVTERRIFNDSTSKPFVDDFYRADNRWGPKPRYDASTPEFDIANQASSVVIGDDITGLDGLTNDEVGLDGYWERQAINAGLRVIVGQRLELGNAHGWNYDPTTGSTTPSADPLYPPNEDADALVGNNDFGGAHEYRQRKSLRDNLAAVQGMVVYHYDHPNGGEFPAACVAATTHPGTRQTIINSRTFDTLLSDTSNVKADFLNGYGTNGWEFQYATAFSTPTGFASQVSSSNALGTALRNLAHFAGDPSGGAPSFKAVQEPDSGTPEDAVHPAPYFTMWGDFSGLRRIFEEYLDNGVPYDDLSFADQATLHNAACTMGMLAYSVEGAYNDTQAFVTDADITDADLNNLSIESTGFRNNLVNTWVPALVTEFGGTITPGNSYSRIELLSAAGAISTDDPTAFTADDEAVMRDIDRISRTVLTGLRAIRDRKYGFIPDVSDPQDAEFTGIASNVPWNTTTSEATAGAGNYVTACDPDLLDGFGTTDPDRLTALALLLCGNQPGNQPYYPALYYLFPVVDHPHEGSTANSDVQPNDEEYIDADPSTPTTLDGYVQDVNGSITYDRLGNSGPLFGIDSIALDPGSSTSPGSWDLPASSAASELADPDDADEAFRIQVSNGGGGYDGIDVAFLDKGIADGREQLSIRVLDMDMDALISETVPGGSDHWIAFDSEEGAEGVVYAAREDAIREDEIVRPQNASSACTANVSGTFELETDTNCLMQALPNTVDDGSDDVFQDPPLTDRGISLKPVDFVADPDRRPYGFRLRTLSRDPADFSNGGDNSHISGMTFVTDNGIFVQGDFNLHSTDGTRSNIIEEFTQLVSGAGGVGYGAPFYNDRDNLNLASFASLNNDHWRPVELLTDALTILSDGFNDGAISDAFTEATPGTVGGGTSSYMNLNRIDFDNPADAPSWYREDGSISSIQASTSPVWGDRNGTFYVENATPAPETFYTFVGADPDLDWLDFGTNFGSTNAVKHRNNLQSADVTYVNAIFVSGIVPKRLQQSYGGLHNYPRFLESWGGTDLFIAGSFIQLNFSTGATGPYEQDAWEPGDSPTANEPIYYYGAPTRRWGYDVALLYQPPGPAASRFVTIGTPRNEYYRELPADDPYVLNLKCAEGDLPDGGNGRIFPNQTCPPV